VAAASAVPAGLGKMVEALMLWSAVLVQLKDILHSSTLLSTACAVKMSDPETVMDVGMPALWTSSARQLEETFWHGHLTIWTTCFHLIY